MVSYGTMAPPLFENVTEPGDIFTKNYEDSKEFRKIIDLAEHAKNRSQRYLEG